MFLRIEETPNPNTVKFIPEEKLDYEGTKLYKQKMIMNNSIYSRQFFPVKGVVSVLLNAEFISVSKTDEEDWTCVKNYIISKNRISFTKKR